MNTMLNHDEHLNALATIANKPGASPRTVLIATRRTCRLLAGERVRLDHEYQALKRQRAALTMYRPFTDAKIAPIEEAIAELDRRAGRLDLSLSNIGRVLVYDPNGIAEALGFDALCDLLSVNPAKRAKARLHGLRIGDIAFTAGAEDSETRRGARWFEKPPLRAAIERAVSLFLEIYPDKQHPKPQLVVH
ncbi:MAG: hypothetical protein FHK79_21950 [Pseudomonas sp.]|nr:MAG: hypothetical protein FHK79_21950 [Pseudomonas sp.]